MRGPISHPYVVKEQLDMQYSPTAYILDRNRCHELMAKCIGKSEGVQDAIANLIIYALHKMDGSAEERLVKLNIIRDSLYKGSKWHSVLNAVVQQDQLENLPPAPAPASRGPSPQQSPRAAKQDLARSLDDETSKIYTQLMNNFDVEIDRINDTITPEQLFEIFKASDVKLKIKIADSQAFRKKLLGRLDSIMRMNNAVVNDWLAESKILQEYIAKVLTSPQPQYLNQQCELLLKLLYSGNLNSSKLERILQSILIENLCAHSKKDCSEESFIARINATSVGKHNRRLTQQIAGHCFVQYLLHLNSELLKNFIETVSFEKLKTMLLNIIPEPKDYKTPKFRQEIMALLAVVGGNRIKSASAAYQKLLQDPACLERILASLPLLENQSVTNRLLTDISLLPCASQMVTALLKANILNETETLISFIINCRNNFNQFYQAILKEQDATTLIFNALSIPEQQNQMDTMLLIGDKDFQQATLDYTGSGKTSVVLPMLRFNYIFRQGKIYLPFGKGKDRETLELSQVYQYKLQEAVELCELKEMQTESHWQCWNSQLQEFKKANPDLYKHIIKEINSSKDGGKSTVRVPAEVKQILPVKYDSLPAEEESVLKGLTIGGGAPFALTC